MDNQENKDISDKPKCIILGEPEINVEVIVKENKEEDVNG